MSQYKLIEKTWQHFTYIKHQPEYDSEICIMHKDTWNKSYKGIQVSSYQYGLNSDGFNNSVGVRMPELILIPFWILHFRIYRLFHRGEV